MCLNINENHVQEISDLQYFTFKVHEKMSLHFRVEPSMRDGKEIRLLACNILKKKGREGEYPKNWPHKKTTSIDTKTCLICLQKREMYSKAFDFNPVLI